jgi:hypothetical protein
LVIGNLRLYAYFFTRIKSPFTSVGIIDPEGIRYGSKTKDLNRKTSNRIGNKAFENSTALASFLEVKCPISQVNPKIMVATNKIA